MECLVVEGLLAEVEGTYWERLVVAYIVVESLLDEVGVEEAY